MLKILVVGPWVPWPAVTGGRQRLANVIRGLTQLGEVDFFCVTHPETTSITPPDDAGIARVHVVSRPPPASSMHRRLLWGPFGKLPAFFFGRDYGSVRSAFKQWTRERYDVVWFARPETFVAVGSEVRAPSIVDFDDLDDRVVLDRLAQTVGGEEGRGRRSTAIARLYARKDARAWRLLQARIAEAVDAVAVCSELDRDRLGLDKAVVVPNGYETPARQAGGLDVGEPPTLMYQGLLTHPANSDAADRLVTEIAPLIRKWIPNLSVRLVGEAPLRVRQMHDPPFVIVTGWVDDITSELRNADVIAVPLRLGSGTRIKILEAFAHGIPVVSTALGAEGLGAVDGRHLLLADNIEAFAEASQRLLTDTDLRARLATEARLLFDSRYRWDRIRDEVAALARSAVSSAPVRN